MKILIHSRGLVAGSVLFIGTVACREPAPCAGDRPFSLVFRGGMVVDGTGAPGVPADVAFCDDTIALIGSVPLRVATKRTIDVAGQVVSPGFIDMLGQSERNVFRYPLALSKIFQGITSEVTGEAESVWPNADFLGVGRNTPWNDLAGYYAFLEKSGTAINLGTYIAAGSLRRTVMGDDRRAPSPHEMAKMQSLLDRGLRDGALGLVAALPYPPADAFTTEQLIELAKPLARYGAGYATHLRSESESLIPAVQEALAIGERADVKVHIHHLKAAGRPNWGKLSHVAEMIDAARVKGLRISADIYPYTASRAELSVLLPAWARTGGASELRRRLAEPATRVYLERLIGDGEWRPEAVVIDYVSNPKWQSAVGKSLKTLADESGSSPAAVVIAILADNGEALSMFFSMDEGDLRTALTKPWVSIGSDAGATYPNLLGRGHPRTFGSFPRVFARYVRNEKILTLEEAVRRMTSLAASQAGIARRGVLRAGYYADVVVFDPNVFHDRATYLRPQLLAAGVSHVMVNGVLALENGKVTGALPGRALRRGDR